MMILMIRINEGKAIEKYLTHMLLKYSKDDAEIYDNFLYFHHLLLNSLEKATQKIKDE